MNTLVRTAAAAAVLCAAMSTAGASAYAQSAAAPGLIDAFRATTLNISAFGEVKATPDMATISLGVQTQAPTAAQAMSENAARMNQVTAALKRAGVEAKDIQTSGLSLGAQYAYEPNKPARLTGYQASNQVTITVNDLARLGATLDAVVAVGANQVNGISFGLKSPQAAEDAARLKAVQALTAKAQLYAGAAGYRLDRLINLSEGGGYSPPRPIVFAAARMAAEESAPTPVEPGQLDIRIDINGVYELTK
jgi:uncharacterized protein YggE